MDISCGCEKETAKFKCGISVNYLSYPLPQLIPFDEGISIIDTCFQMKFTPSITNIPYIIQNK